MYLCYLDESGTPDLPGNTSHYVLVGLSIPIWHWRDCDREVGIIRRRYGLEDKEIHTAWILRTYFEQSKIPNFQTQTYFQRRQSVDQYRRAELLRLQRQPTNKAYKQARKTLTSPQSLIQLL